MVCQAINAIPSLKAALLELSHNMDQNYHQQYRALCNEYHSSADSFDIDHTMDHRSVYGTFADDYLSHRAPEGMSSPEVHETATTPAPTLALTPAVSISSQSSSDCGVSLETSSSPAPEPYTPLTAPAVVEDLKRSHANTVSIEPERPRPRIGHKKSRAGCFNCKKRYVHPMLNV